MCTPVKRRWGGGPRGEGPHPPDPLSLPRERGSLRPRFRFRSTRIRCPCGMFRRMRRTTDNNEASGERVAIAKTRRLRMTDAARELRRRSTPSEQTLWREVRDRRLDGYRFRRQQPIGPYIVDFFCSAGRLIVEIDGPVHETQAEYDRQRQREIEAAGYRFLRVTADRVLHALPGVLAESRAALAASPPLPRQGEGAGG